MTDRLAEIRERCEKATKGPWKYDEELGANFSMISGNGVVVAGIPNPLRGDEDEDLPETRANGKLIAAARTDIPYLLEALAAADAKIKELEYILDYARGGVEGNLRRMQKELEGAKGILSRDALTGAIEHTERTLERIAGAIGFGIDPRQAPSHAGRDPQRTPPEVTGA